MTEQSPAEALFFAALDKATPEERAAYLDAECRDDSNLRGQVERLLAAHPQLGSYLEPASLDLNATTDQPKGEAPGTIIAGRFKLLEEIGAGGMGTVWVAEQMQPVRRKVALKLIKAGMDSKAVLSRFSAERQALALMDHPNIAKVLDGGMTEGGRPFFVMEYVKGVPFTKYCDDARLSIAERLVLFVPICQAIQHAHQKGIIHRDLKPSNILVCLYDGKPVPKVIDFGLAKAMHQRLTEHTLHTAHGEMVGTPLYMSPEQAEFNNLDVDTRTDIYALGVILYELLTGTTPLEKQRFKDAAWHEMLRLIKEEEPPRPSARLSGSSSLPSLAAERQMEPTKLPRLVSGELDWIVMKCLEKDRSRRYETATGLARDVDRYLADEAVEACPPSAGYRLRKFARKHHTALATAATILLLLIAGVAVSTWQAVRAIHAEGQTALQRDRAIEAEREARNAQVKAQQAEQQALNSAAQATAMSSFFQELALEARRAVRTGDSWRAKTVDEAVAIIDSEKVRAIFAIHPLAEAEIREWIATNAWPASGGVMTNLSYGLEKGTYFIQDIDTGNYQVPVVYNHDPDKAQEHLKRALELRSAHLGPNDPRTLATMHLLGQTLLQFDEVKALQVFRDLVARSIASLGADHKYTSEYKDSLAKAVERADDWQTYNTKSMLGGRLIGRKEFAQAEALLLAGYEGMKQREARIPNESKVRLADALERLVQLYDTMGKKDKAEEWRKKLQEAKNAGTSGNP